MQFQKQLGSIYLGYDPVNEVCHITTVRVNVGFKNQQTETGSENWSEDWLGPSSL